MKKNKHCSPRALRYQTLIRGLYFLSPLLFCIVAYIAMQLVLPAHNAEELRSPFSGLREVTPQVYGGAQVHKAQILRREEPAPQMPHPSHITQPLQAIPEWHRFPPLPERYKSDKPIGMRLLLAVSDDGSVEEVLVQQSTGTRSLDQQAIEWVKAHWRYKPAYNGTKPVAATTSAILFFEKQPISP